MIEVLRDGAWQFIGALVSVLAIFVAVVIFFLQRKRKELAFGVLSERGVLTMAEELAQRVRVLFDGVPVSNIQLIELGFKNSGNKPILATDFERPFSIAFGADARLLSADIVTQFPHNLGAQVVANEKDMLVEPVLLNPGDYFVAKALVSTSKLRLRPDVRIIGVPELAPLSRGIRMRPGALRNFVEISVMFLVVGILFIGLKAWVGASQDEPRALPPIPWSYVAALIMGPIVVLGFIHLGSWVIGYFNNSGRRYIDGA